EAKLEKAQRSEIQVSTNLTKTHAEVESARIEVQQLTEQLGQERQRAKVAADRFAAQLDEARAESERLTEELTKTRVGFAEERAALERRQFETGTDAEEKLRRLEEEHAARLKKELAEADDAFSRKLQAVEAKLQAESSELATTRSALAEERS